MLLVVGATGELGGMITRRLVARGVSVRALVRQHTAHRQLALAGAQPVLGDLKDLPSLKAACRSVDTVIMTANSANGYGNDTPQTVERAGMRNLIDAARAAGVGQIIFVSTQCAHPASPVPFFQAKAQAEQYLRTSGVPYTILVPDMFMDFWVARMIADPALAGQPVWLAGSGDDRHTFIAASDVAAFAVASVGHPIALNRRIALGGPQVLSWRDVVAFFARALGHPITIGTLHASALLDTIPALARQMLAVITHHETIIDSRGIARVLGVRQTPLASFVHQTLLKVARTA